MEIKNKVEYIDINKLTLLQNNPRQISKDNFEKLKKSIKSNPDYFEARPIICSDRTEKLVILAGNQRYKASKDLGLKQVPCIILHNLTEEKEKEIIIRDNVELGDWDYDLLANDWEVEDLQEWGVNVPEIIQDDNEQEIIEDEVPEEVETKCKLGDIWKLGDHRLMCGDSTKVDDVEKLMNGNKADLLFTDPPYNVNIEQKKKKILRCNKYNKIENDNLPMEEFKQFLSNVFKNAYTSLKETASYYVFSCQGGDQEMMMMMMRESGIPCRHQLIWVKDAPVFSMGRLDYDYKHEPILYGWVKKHDFKRKGEQDKSVWEYKRTENKIHPTMKPVELICNALKNSTDKDNLVLDLFGGSGSTLIACEQLKRKCFMMELDEHYCDVIIQRWENLTGQKAIKIN